MTNELNHNEEYPTDAEIDAITKELDALSHEGSVVPRYVEWLESSIDDNHALFQELATVLGADFEATSLMERAKLAATIANRMAALTGLMK